MLNIQVKLSHLRITFVLTSVFMYILFSFIFYSCKKLIEVDPPNTRVTGASVFQSDATAVAVLNGLYIDLSSISAGSPMSISYLAGLSSDEFTLAGTDNRLRAFYINNLFPGDGSSSAGAYGTEFFSFHRIFTCNTVIESLTDNHSLTPSVRKQLLGEAKFMRAFYYYYLTNIYGDVPLVLTTDYKVNSNLSRAPKNEVYKQIINDLKEAEILLNENFLQADAVNLTTERVRPTKWAAAALLARVYLYNKDWQNAEHYASLVINHHKFSLTPLLNQTFLKNSSEAIWQVQPTTPGYNIEIARMFVLPLSGPNNNQNQIHLSTHLLNAFEPGDMRKKPGNWIDSINVGGTPYIYPFKYKINTPNSNINSTTGTENMIEYLMILRLAEQYLIRAEARAHQDNVLEAQNDLNKIRNRAGLLNTTVNDKPSLLAAIQHERQVELFTEWGDRWLNLKRTESINQIMLAAVSTKGGTWESFKALYPIPSREIEKNPKLSQNAGY